MNASLKRPTDLPLHLVRDLVDHHGLWAVLRAALKPRPPDLHRLSDHTRRDIGLPPLDPPGPRHL